MSAVVHIPPGLAQLNAMSVAESHARLYAVCSSKRWADAMVAARPFASVDSLFAVADEQWFALSPSDWLEAFSHHPRIGQTNLSQPKFAATADQSRREQSGMAGASDELRAHFAELNEQYQDRFGHVFLICATGKSAEQMLAAIQRRVTNDAPTELANAAKEQSLITRIRLQKLVDT